MSDVTFEEIWEAFKVTKEEKINTHTKKRHVLYASNNQYLVGGGRGWGWGVEKYPQNLTKTQLARVNKFE